MEKEHELVEITETVKAMANGNFHRAVSLDLKGELGKLAFYIDKVRTNLQILEPGVKESTEKVPMVKDSLKSVTKAAEEGTHRVIGLSENMLDDCDRISEVAKILREKSGEGLRCHIDTLEQVNEKHRSDLLEILTSLSFQDLTGQRLKKLEDILVEIESRVLHLLVAFGISVRQAELDSEGGSGKTPFHDKIESHMESLRKGDLSQDLVDSILEEFSS